MSQNDLRRSIFSPSTPRRQDLETSPEPSNASSSRSGDDTSEASVSEPSTDSEASSSLATSDVESSSGSEHDGASSDDASDSEDPMDASDDDGDGIGDADALKRSDPKAAAWLRRTAEERAICDGLERDEEGNLTQHIMNSHGFYASHYSPNSKPSTLRRKQWISGWCPQPAWTAWPMPPAEVPRRPYRVWDASIMMNEQWVPSRDLESEVFAYMLKKSRLRWKRSVRASLVTETERDSKHSRKPAPDRKLTEDEKQELDENIILDSTEENPERDEIVFSADDEKSWAIARPAVRSILTKFDSVLAALRSSADLANKGHCEIRKLVPEE
jgi:hypothetical protein